MEKSKYEVLLKVVELGSFSAAAQELGYTASGMNRMMGALEEEFGITLFNRNVKGVHLTGDGEKILPILQKIVFYERQLREYTDEARGLQAGEINIGTIYSIAIMWLPDIVNRFKQLHPNIMVNILQGSHLELNEWLQQGKVDLILTSKRDSHEHWITLKRDPMVVWINKGNPLAKKISISKEDLESQPFIFTMPGQDTDTEYAIKQRKIHLSIQYSNRDCYSTYRMVDAGLGISINNLMMSHYWNGNVETLPLDPPDYVDLGIHYPKHCSLSAQKFIEVAQEVIRNMSTDEL